MPLSALHEPDVHAEDRALADRIRRGDGEAFRNLYLKYKQPIYLFCLRMIGDHLAEDIFHDVFMNCYEQLRKGTEIVYLKSYLFSSARNRCLNVIRDRRPDADLFELSDVLPAPTTHDVVSSLSIQQALLELPPLNREAFLLCEYEGYSYEEIADITRAPLTTVRKRIYRARHKLRHLLSLP